MLEALEKFRKSEGGKTAFYIFAGIALALLAMALIKPIKITAFTNNGNRNHIKGKVSSLNKKGK